MEPVNGVKVFAVGECDHFFAPTKEEAIEAANKMLGNGWVGPDGEVLLEEVIELSDAEFEKFKLIVLDDNENILKDEDGNPIYTPAKEHLEELISDGSKSGMFSSKEW